LTNEQPEPEDEAGFFAKTGAGILGTALEEPQE